MTKAETADLQYAETAAEEPVTDEVMNRRQIIWRRLRGNRLALTATAMIVLLYIFAIFAGFLSPHNPEKIVKDRIHAPPMLPRIMHNGQLSWPFVYELTADRSADGMERVYTIDRDSPRYIQFFFRGDEYHFLGLFETTIHFVGVPDFDWRPLGGDRLGRDLLSRMIYGGRVSLTIGLIGVAITTIIGTLIGALSGYFGGIMDTLVQRGIELLMSFPSIPLWIALAAALPPTWSPVKTYLGIIIILSLIGWGGLARQIRGLVLSYRERDYIKAAVIAGGSDAYVIIRHLVPNCYGYLIVIATLSIPATILGETALSFLGLGVRPPMISWGTLLEEAQKVRVLVQYPWLLLPAVPVLLTVVSFNLLGDALRDAISPSGK